MGKSRAIACAAAAALVALTSSWSAQAQAVSPPDVVKLPSGLDLGGSSFYDGFGRTDPGWIFLNFARWNHLTSIKDISGNNSPLFAKPRIDTFSNLFHVVYVSPISVPDGAITFEALLPIVGFQSRFGSPGLALQDNGWNIGDLTFGTDYQSRILRLGKASILSWRAGVDVTAPTGAFDARRDLNQGSGYWSVVPYLAATILPIPKWEISARANYDYNFVTSRGANPPPIPGFAFHDGRAGQAAWVNFASSYEMVAGIRPGIAGYWLRQLEDDRTNGVPVPQSRVEELYIGPGLSWQVSRKTVMNFNVYLPLEAKNTAAGPQFNIQSIIRF